jgi:hypothetical protein
MKVLIACEESQTVCKAFRERGHEAYSCDIQEPSGGHPEWHILGDAIAALDGGVITTMDGKQHDVGKWDLLIAHPPCTYLSNVATRSFSLRCTPAEKVVKRWENRAKAAIFFMHFILADIPHIAVENPVGFMNTGYRKPDQIIHPYMFADSVEDGENYHEKRTCLWLKNLPLLKRTSNLPVPPPMYISQGKTPKKVGWCEGMRGTTNGQEGRAKARSKTFSGIADAMAEQWGGVDG